jgi:hypothetical protein
MTILSLDSSTISSKLEKIMSSSENTASQTVSQLWSIPRINLRKRPCATKMTNLESVNSAFLSGLFADVAKASENTSDDLFSHQPKKVRIGKCKSIARCERSFAVLMKALNDASEGDPSSESCANSNTAIFGDIANTISTIQRDNSLQYQLDCVTASSPSTASSKSADISSATGVVFPNLPATVSNSSYGNSMNTSNSRHPASSPITTLTHVISDLQSSDTEKTSQTLANDTYGWFVEMEDESNATNAISTPNSTSCLPLVDSYFAPKDLAFTAQVAPKAENYDAELEWATAADTVDDVLGCFF